ncbi:MAG: hypothetical protein V3T21_03600 [Candidatus Margulisiibacteriota bacterium]
MTAIIRLKPHGGVQKAGKILFAAQMLRPQGYLQPANALAYLAPNLLKAGYEVELSQAETFPRNPIMRERIETSRSISIIRQEIEKERPDFVAFPTYDSNAPRVLEMAKRIQRMDNPPALIFGASFITINPRESQEIYGAFPNVILINGEAEYALPRALDVFQSGNLTVSPGIFVKREGSFLGGDFMTRVSLSGEEHEALEVNFDVFEETYAPLEGLEMTTSRGCFEGCTFCASSGVFRRTHSTWSVEKKIAMLKEAKRWLEERGASGRASIGFPDDSFFYNLREGIEFLKALRQDPIVDEVEIVPQISFGPFFRTDGSFAKEIPNLMLRPDGSPFVRRVSVGVDFWSEPERLRNKGKREGRLTNQQIEQAVAAFTEKKIVVHAYWLMGDEQTNLTSFSQGVLFLSELLLDHAPYFVVDQPEPLELRTGTPLRDRVLSTPGLPEGYIKIADRIGSDKNEVLFYEPIFPKNELIKLIYAMAVTLKVQAGQTPYITPDVFLAFLAALEGKWENEVMDQKGRTLVRQYLKLRKKGRSQEAILGSNPLFRNLPTEFPFLGNLLSFDIQELLELVEIERVIPRYFRGGGEELMAEQLRRNPHYYEQLAELKDRNL